MPRKSEDVAARRWIVFSRAASRSNVEKITTRRIERVAVFEEKQLSNDDAQSKIKIVLYY